MANFKILVICLIFLMLSLTNVFGKDSYCQNISFDLGNFTNWTGYSWIYSIDKPHISTPKVAGIIYGRHTIMKDVNAYDYNTGGALQKVPTGYKYSARLGDAVKGAQMESLSYSIKVDSSNALLIWKFAVVLQDPVDNHKKIEEPRFRVSLFDQNGDTIPDCANYDVYFSDAKVNGFNTYYPSYPDLKSPVIWRDWTTVGANLLPYIGKTITIEFMAGGCTRTGHYGYAYFIAECFPLYITVKYCTDDSSATLDAPIGFDTYSWTDMTGKVLWTGKSYTITNPIEGTEYMCNMTSATGCTVSLKSKIERYLPKTGFESSMLDCKSNSVQFKNLSVTDKGSLKYKWSFGDGSTSSLKDPVYKFSTSGFHKVSLEVSNPPSLCIDVLEKMVESFSPPLVGFTGDLTYCPNKTTTLKAYGANSYMWSNGSTADSIVVGAPDKEIWLVGYSSNGCVSDTTYKSISLEPDWDFKVNEESSYCQNDSLTLIASGANKYLWIPSNKTTNSINVKEPGKYTVIGANARGCEKIIEINVTENKLPNVDFVMSSSSVNRRYNQLTCSIPQEEGVKYFWNFGDNDLYPESGSEINHSYTDLPQIGKYKVSLLAVSKFGCKKTFSQEIEIVPFFPNVFTPNGDGVNDLLMEGLELTVYDRNGLTLYKGLSGWDGKYNGKVMDNDTYYYMSRYVDVENKSHTKKGSVTLLR